MYFDPDADLAVFGPLLEKRPEISVESLKADLNRYFLPFAKKLIGLQSGDANLIVGVSAIQGAGKTTQGEIMETLLNHLGFSTCSLSIDDHYLTHKQLVELRRSDPRFIRRGVTHDIPLAVRDLTALKNMQDGKPILISGYDKGANLGDGERFRWVNLLPGFEIRAKVVQEELMVNKVLQHVQALQIIEVKFAGNSLKLPENMGSDVPVVEPLLPAPLCRFLSQQTDEILITQPEVSTVKFTGSSEISVDRQDLPNGWKVVYKKPHFVFYDGWMLGARKVEDESVFDQNLPALETARDREFAKFINNKLAQYEPLWEMIQFLNLLYVPNYQKSLQWRDQAEEALRAKGEGMSPEQIKEFVYYFWRSVHPAVHIKRLAKDPLHTRQVVLIGDDHSILDVLTPDQVKLKYP